MIFPEAIQLVTANITMLRALHDTMKLNSITNRSRCLTFSHLVEIELAINSLHTPSSHAAPPYRTLPETLPIFQSLVMILILSLSPITIISRPRSARQNNNPTAYSSREQMSFLFHAGLAAALTQLLKPPQVTSKATSNRTGIFGQ
jgi:hypothetical protein